MTGNWTFNSEECYFNIFIFRIGNKKETEVEIPNEIIDSVTITSDIEEIFPTVEIILKDPFSHLIPNYMDDGKSGIEIYYQRHNKILQHNFIITQINLTEHNLANTIYVLKGSSTLHNILDSTIMYSTGGDNIDPITILNEILKITFTKETFVKNEDLLVPVKKINYITPVNYTLKNNIDFLLLEAHNEISGFYFVQYDIFENKLTVINTTQIFNKGTYKFKDILGEDVAENTNVNEIHTKFSKGSSAITVEQLSRNNYISKTDQNRLATNNIILKEFDQTSRSWTQKDYFHKINMSFLPEDSDVKKERIAETPLFPQLTELDSIKTEKHFIQEPNTFKRHSQRLIDYFMFGNVLQITALGTAQRTVGEAYLINIQKDEQPIAKWLKGKHMISRIYHTFQVSDHIFSNDISIVRTQHQKLEGGEYEPAE